MLKPGDKVDAATMIASLRQIIDLEAEAENRARRLSAILNSGNATGAEQAAYFGTLQEIAGYKSAVSQLKQSVMPSVPGTGSITDPSLITPFTPIRNRAISDPTGFFNMAAAYGGAPFFGRVGGELYPQNPQGAAYLAGSMPVAPGGVAVQNVVNDIVRSAQVSQNQPTLQMPIDPTLQMPNYMYNWAKSGAAALSPYPKGGTPAFGNVTQGIIASTTPTQMITPDMDFTQQFDTGQFNSANFGFGIPAASRNSTWARVLSGIMSPRYLMWRAFGAGAGGAAETNLAAAGIIGYEAVSALTGFIGNRTSETLSGQYNYVGRSQSIGQLVGGILGAGVGTLLAPGVGTVAGGVVGGEIGSALLGFLGAGSQVDYENQQQLDPFGPFMRGSTWAYRAGGFATNDVNNYVNQFNSAAQENISPQDYTATFTKIASALMTKGGNTQGAQTLTEELLTRYYKGAPAVAGSIAGMLSDPSIQTGADAIMKYGPGVYNWYKTAQGQTESQSARIGATFATASMRDRQAQIFGLTAQSGLINAGAFLAGGGRADNPLFGQMTTEGTAGLVMQMQQLTAERAAIASLPGGTESRAYFDVQKQISSLNLERQNIANDYSTRIVGLHQSDYAAALAQSQTGFQRSLEFSSTPGGINKSLTDLTKTLQDFQKQLSKDMSLPNLHPEQINSMRQASAEIDRQLMEARIQARETEVSRALAPIEIREAQAGFGFRRAQVIGGAGDVRQASASGVSALYSESMEIGRQLQQGGLPFDAQQRLRRRQIEIGQSIFDLQQSSIDLAYQKEDIGFETRHMQVGGVLERLRLMPFSPGNIFGLSLTQARMDATQLTVLDVRERQLAQTGNLSPERALQIEQQRQRLLTEQAQTVSLLSEGMENRLPALSAGRPSFFSRFDSWQLAALNLFRIGSPIRSYGAVNGRHAQQQNEFAESFGVNGFFPRSTTEGINTALPILERIASAVERMANGATSGTATRTRPSETKGYTNGMLGQSDLGQDNVYQNSN